MSYANDAGVIEAIFYLKFEPPSLNYEECAE